MPATFDLVFVAFVLLLAGFVKGVIGLGLPTISVGLLGVVMSPIAAASLLVAPNLVTNVWQLATGPAFRGLLLRLWPMMAAIALGTLAGAPLIGLQSKGWAIGALGLTLAAYAGLGLAGLHWRVWPAQERLIGPLVGFATGAITTVTGVFVVPAVPYLQALGLRKDELVQALGLSFLVSTIALAVVLAGAGIFESRMALGSLAALVPALAGMALGTRLRAVIPATTFRSCFFAGLLALGAYLVWRGNVTA